MTSVNGTAQSIVSQLSPTESAEFASMFQQVLPQLQGLALAHDSYTPPVSAGSSPISAEYMAMSPREQSDFDNFCNAIVQAMGPSATSPAAVTPAPINAAPVTTPPGTATPTVSTGGAAGASGSPEAQMQYWQQKYMQDWANPSTQGQAAQDWQNYLAAAQTWQTQGVSGAGGSNGSVTYAPITTGPVTDGPVTDGPLTSGPVTTGPTTGGPQTPTPTTGILHQPTTSIWTKDSVEKASANSIAGMPDSSQWQSFDSLWSKATPLMQQAGDSAQEIEWIKEGINDEASKTGVDPRIILAQIMQESGGNVRVPTTNNGVRNPGLMQSYNGSTFDPNNPEASIKQMIKDGVEGTWEDTGGGIGLADCITQAGSVWAGLRMYNSGSVDLSNLSNGLGATSQYVTQMEHKLVDGNFTS